MKKKIIKLSLLILVVAFSIFGYATHFFEYLLVCAKGRMNLSEQLKTIEKFKDFPEDNLFYNIILTSKDSSLIRVSNNAGGYDILSLKSVLLNGDSLGERFSISRYGTLLEKYADTLKEYENWQIVYRGKNKATQAMNRITGLLLHRVVSNLASANCHELYGRKNDLTLSYNKSINMKRGCIVTDWYDYHYYLGDKNKLDSLGISYNENDAGIYYGWW